MVFLCFSVVIIQILGAVGLLHIPFAAGVTVAIQNRFDPAVFCGNIQKYRITAAMVVPPILVVLVRHNGVLASLPAGK